MPTARYSEHDPVTTGMRGRCPRCAEGALFSGLSVREKCSACNLSFDFSDEGDGPTVFIILALGFIVLGLALYVELTYEPSIWVHVLAWPPLVLLLGIPAMRAVKGILICQQYKYDAAPGTLANETDETKR